MPERSKKISYPDGLSSPFGDLNKQTQIARVTDIILNPDHPRFLEFGGFPSIGTVFYSIDDVQGSNTGNTARPFNPNNSTYPLINELIFLIPGPNTNIGSNTSSKSFYYLTMFSIWNSPHHNAYPNPVTPNTPEGKFDDYFKTDSENSIRKTDQNFELEIGSTNEEEGNSTSLNSPFNISQNTFIERTNIHPLLPLPGDSIQSGRWGNSIRFGSTVNPNKNNPPNDLTVYNNWSDSGKNGDPITLIRNGQDPNTPKEGWVPITENINKDLSSIYLTSTQQIPIVTNPVLFNNKRYTSYTPSSKELPTSVSSFNGNQVIINSGRLVFNSKTDHIMLSSNRTISFEAVKGFNFDTNSNFVIQVGTTIKLGSKDATEPIVKGEALRVELFNLCTNLKQLVQQLQLMQVTIGDVVSDNALSITAASTEIALNSVLASVTKDDNDNTPILSSVSKTI